MTIENKGVRNNKFAMSFNDILHEGMHCRGIMKVCPTLQIFCLLMLRVMPATSLYIAHSLTAYAKYLQLANMEQVIYMILPTHYLYIYVMFNCK